MIRPTDDPCDRCNGTGVTFLSRVVGRRVRCSCPAGQQIADASSPTTPSSLHRFIAPFASR